MLQLRGTGGVHVLEVTCLRLEEHLLDAQFGHGSRVGVGDVAQLGGYALAEDHQLIVAGRLASGWVVLHFSLCWRAGLMVGGMLRKRGGSGAAAAGADAVAPPPCT